MKIKCTGVILAGGNNRRLPGIHKGFQKVGNKKIIDYILKVHKKLFNEVIIVTNNPEEYGEYDANIVTDIFKIRSSLAGIHAGLFYSSNPFIFLSACDTPFLKKKLVLKIINSYEKGKTVIIPKTSKGIEPLCAVYSKECLVNIERNIKSENLAIRGFFKKSRTEKKLCFFNCSNRNLI